jgi:hypothetical protein
MQDTLFEAGDIRITRNIASFGNTSYSVANIVSVSVNSKTVPSLLQLIVVIGFLAAIVWAALFYSWVVAGILFVVMFVTPAILPPNKELSLIFKTSSGDVQALTSKDSELVAGVKLAIESAFSART